MKLLTLGVSPLLLLLSANGLCASSNMSKPRLLPHHSPQTPQGTEGGFWHTDGNSEPTLRFKNVLLHQPIDVTPSIFFADGTEYKLPVLHMEAAGIASVNMIDAIQQVPAPIRPHVSTFGMAGATYQWSWPAIIATIQNIDEIASLTKHSSSLANVTDVHKTPEQLAPHVIRGTWWIYAPTTDGFLAVENASLTEKQVQVAFTDHMGKEIAEKEVTLPKHGTTLLRLSEILKVAQNGKGRWWRRTALPQSQP